ncbi:uncharacterized protein LOC5514778 isoform X2 [Nematostella vectensis]|uniref:uncharacterized protein LOC5514778 isoform X2 n=1 Tax=Nematostella vectensis TaxID=45351 RepID=UPI00207719EA|nr:uncharacterized protein LOC5514778 isoform X2 [Nematostella vectensis]
MDSEQSFVVAQAIASSMGTLLGPSLSTKCVIDEGDEIICNSAAYLMQYLDIQHPAGFIINNACQGMHKRYGTGCKTLVCMIGSLCRTTAELVEQGVSVSSISRLNDEALAVCLNKIEAMRVPVEIFLESIVSRKNSNKKASIEISEHVPKSNYGSRRYEDVSTLCEDKSKFCMESQTKYLIDDEFDACLDDIDTRQHNQFTTQRTSTKTRSPSQQEQLKKTQEMLKFLSFNCKKNTATTQHGLQNITRTSRHIAEDSQVDVIHSDKVLHDASNSSRTSKIFNKDNLEILAETLTGESSFECRLAAQVIHAQLSTQKRSNLSVITADSFHFKSVVGLSACSSQLVQGLLLQHTIAPVAGWEDNDLRAVLINGDVTHTFKNVGYNDSFKAQQEFTDVNLVLHGTTLQSSWFKRIVEALRNYRIGAIFTTGEVDESVSEYCRSSGIFVFARLSLQLLQLLSLSTGTMILVYLLDVQDKDFGSTVTVSRSEFRGWRLSKSNEDSPYALVHCRGSIPLRTALICASSKHQLTLSENVFWRAFNRTRNTLQCGMVLPGKGLSEAGCIAALENYNGEDGAPCLFPSNWIDASQGCYRSLVFHAFASSLRHFLARALMNEGHTNYDAMTLVQEIVKENFTGETSMDRISLVDDYFAKCEALKRAVGVVRLLLMADETVTTGLQGSHL